MAQLSMKYAEYAASPRLAWLVERFWMLEGPGSNVPDAILPDGRIELVFHVGARFNRHRLGGIERQPLALLAGQLTEPLVLSHEGDARVAAIRLRPSAAQALLRFSVIEITGRIVDLETVLPPTGELRERLFDARDDRERIACLERWLEATWRRVSALRSSAAPPADVDAVVSEILRTDGRARIATVAARVGLGPRRLQRRFADAVGLSPKQFARIIRLQRALRLVRSGLPLADVALACGYYDQAHMALDFRHLAAMSPDVWREHAGALAPLFVSQA